MHIISVACCGFLTLYFLADSLAHRMMVETMKMVANPANKAMAMRQRFATLRVLQGRTSVLGEPFEASQGLDAVARVDLVDGTGDVLASRGIKIPAGLVELAEEVEIEESFQAVVLEDLMVKLDPIVSGDCDVETWVLVLEMG